MRHNRWVWFAMVAIPLLAALVLLQVREARAGCNSAAGQRFEIGGDLKAYDASDNDISGKYICLGCAVTFKMTVANTLNPGDSALLTCTWSGSGVGGSEDKTAVSNSTLFEKSETFSTPGAKTVTATVTGTPWPGEECVTADSVDVTVVKVEFPSSFDHVCTTAVHAASHDVAVTLSPTTPGIDVILKLSRATGAKGDAVFYPSMSHTTNISSSASVTVMGTEHSDQLTNMLLKAYLEGYPSCLCTSRLFTVVDATNLVAWEALHTINATNDATQVDDTNTLYICQTSNDNAELEFQLWWTPSNYSSNEFLWDIVLTNGEASATQWNATNGNFAVNPTNSVWTNSASAGGQTNREFRIRSWFDCDENDSYTNTEPHRIIDVKVVDFVKLMLTNSACTNSVTDVTRPNEPPSTNNTLYLCEGTNGTAEMDIQGWWLPENVNSNWFRWEIVTNSTATTASPQWTANDETFATNPVTVVWTNSAAGESNREFLVRGWYDCDKDGTNDVEEPHRQLYVTVVDFVKLMLTNSACSNGVVDVTRPDEPATTNNTLYLCEGTNGTAEMDIQGWWLPETVSSNKFRWEIVLTNGASGATQWNLTNGVFTTNPAGVTWTNSASSGVTNREFLVRGWYDCDGEGDYDAEEPHRSLYVTIIKVDLTEAKGLYTSNGTYQAGYTSTDDVGRVYCNRIYNSTNLSETIWTSDKQYVDFTVTLTPTNVTLPADARIVWEWEDPDDPSDSGMNAAAAAVIDTNDYDSADSDGDGNDQDGNDNSGGLDGASVWEEIDAAYALSGGNETAISNGISKVRFNVTDDAGDNFIVKAKLKLNAGATPCDGDETGVMTVWKKIGMEYVKMTTGLALPVGDLPGEFEICYVEFNVDPVRGVADNYVFTNGYWYMGTNSATAYGKCLDYVTAASGEFSKEGAGWFFIASANRYAPVGSGSSEVLYPASGTASNATALVNKITLPTAIPSNKTPDIVYIYDSTLASNVLFVVKEGTLSADRKTFEIEKKDYYPVDDPYTSFLDADLTDYGFASNSTIQARVLSPGAYGVGGISPGLAGKTIIFTRWSGADCLDTMVHEMTHAFGLAHKCGNWDHTTTTPTESCPMNYGSWFILDDTSPRAPIQWTNKRTGTSLCAPHIKAVRESNLEDLPGLGW